MAIIKPFKGYKPRPEFAREIASLPYDVISSEEARIEVKKNPESFLRVVKPEVDLPKNVDVHSEEVYLKGRENLQELIKEGVLVQDESDCLYVYAQTMNNRTQYGLVACASVEDYLNDRIKKHELTRPDKEIDRKNHIRYSNFNAEPVFFTYPDHHRIDEIIKEVISNNAEFDFIADDQIGHHLWTIYDKSKIDEILNIFKNDIPFTYVADGHHRTAAAAHVGEEKKNDNPAHQGNEEYNYFLAVHFPFSQLKIFDYNRVVKDLNGLDAQGFIDCIREHFDVEPWQEAYYPEKIHSFGLYLGGRWYKLSAKNHTYNDDDPINSLDVTVLYEFILKPVLDIQDLRKSKRIDFVGGIRGLKELEKRVNSGEMKAAFSLFPVSMEQLVRIADTGNIMPPKTTWFEPKLRSGLVLHELE